MKIYDCFLLNNEIDLLEIRMNILDDWVDYFLIVQNSFTFSGLPKANIDIKSLPQFQKFKHKILDYHFSIIKSSTNFWLNEYTQRDLIKHCLSKNNLSLKDIILLSDLDEIINPNFLNKLNLEDIICNKIYTFRQKLFYYYLNLQANEIWNGTQLFRYEYLQTTTPQEIRDRRNESDIYIEDGGWHFSYLGNTEQILTKLKSYAHSEYSDIEPWRIDLAKQYQADLFGRKEMKFNKVDIETLPIYIQQNKQKFKDYLIC